MKQRRVVKGCMLKVIKDNAVPGAPVPLKEIRKTDGTAYFTPSQLAARWGFHPESIRRLIRQGQIEAVVLHRRLLVPVAAVERIESEGRLLQAA